MFSGFLLLAAIVLLVPSPAAAQTDPPASGNWVIADQTTVTSSTVQVNGNLIVENGGSLTLTGVNLRMASTYPGEFAILVKSGGNLTVSGGSIVALSAGNTYRFEIIGWARIDNVQPIRDMWGSPNTDKFGIQIYNGNVSLTNSTITNGDHGNILVSAQGSPLISRNVISASRYAQGGNTSFCNGMYLNIVAIGIMVTNGSTPLIQYNTIRDNGVTTGFVDPWRDAVEWLMPSCPTTYYYIYEFMLGYGIAVRGASPEVLDNTITLNSAYIQTSGYQYYSPNVTVYVSHSNQNWNTGEAGAGMWLSGSGKGNITGNIIDRNYAAGVYGDGSQAFFEGNLVANHTSTAGIAVGGGFTGANFSLRNNAYGISLVGTGVGSFDRIDFGAATTGIAVYADYQASGTLNIYNTSFANFNTSTVLSFQSYQGAIVSLFNCTIDQTKIVVSNWGQGSVNIFWSLRVKVQWPNGAPASAAFAIITNQSDGVLYADATDSAGLSPDIWVPGYRITMNGNGAQTDTTNADLSVKVYTNGTISDPFTFHFNGTTFVTLTITDPIPPSLNIFFPTNGQGFTTSTVHITGNAFDVGSGMSHVSVSGDGGATWTNSTEPLPGWGVDLELADGTYDLLVRAFDLSGTHSELAVTGIRVDTVAPDILILQPSLPTTGALISYTTFTAVVLQGKVADDTTLTLNGDPLPVSGGSFSRQLIMNEGPNYYILVAVDGVGNRDEVSFILVSDITKPALFVSSPTENFATNRSIITVAGVTETDIALTMNDRTIRTTGGVFSEPYALSEGNNTLRITATDRAGNNNTIIRRVVFDTVAPDITLISPTPNLVTNANDLLVAGSVEPAILTVYVNGAPVSTLNGVFGKHVRLDEGRNVIAVQAWDSAGNPSTLATVVTLDSTPPELAVTSPADQALVNTATVTVRGTSANATQLSVNGVGVSVLSLEFEESVALVEGPNVIVVEAVDGAGNTVRTQVTVTRDTDPPTITLDLPATPKHTQDNVIVVTGRTSGAVALRANGQLIAYDQDGLFTVTVELTMGENRITFTAEDLAGNEVTVLGAVVRDPIPETPQGLFGLGDLQYLLLPLFLVAGIAGTFLVVRRPRKGVE